MLIYVVRSLHVAARGMFAYNLPVNSRAARGAVGHSYANGGLNQYCEFGGTVKKCEEWLEKNHLDMHEKLYSEGVCYFSSQP